MSGPDCLGVVEAFLREELAGNDIQKAISRWNDLEQCSREDGELNEAFTDRFDTTFTAMAAANPGLKMPEDNQDKGRKNRTGANGKTLKCFHCDSEYHLAPYCKSKKKKESGSSSEDVMLTQENDSLLAAGQIKSFIMKK